MVRRKVEIEKLPTENQRRSTFSKRKLGLFNKARELSTLCDVDLALVVFSPKDELLEFTPSTVGHVLHRYLDKGRELGYHAHPELEAVCHQLGRLEGRGHEIAANSRQHTVMESDANLRIFTPADLGRLREEDLMVLENVVQTNLRVLQEFANKRCARGGQEPHQVQQPRSTPPGSSSVAPGGIVKNDQPTMPPLGACNYTNKIVGPGYQQQQTQVAPMPPLVNPNVQGPQRGHHLDPRVPPHATYYDQVQYYDHAQPGAQRQGEAPAPQHRGQWQAPEFAQQYHPHDIQQHEAEPMPRAAQASNQAAKNHQQYQGYDRQHALQSYQSGHIEANVWQPDGNMQHAVGATHRQLDQQGAAYTRQAAPAQKGMKHNAHNPQEGNTEQKGNAQGSNQHHHEANIEQRRINAPQQPMRRQQYVAAPQYDNSTHENLTHAPNAYDQPQYYPAQAPPQQRSGHMNSSNQVHFQQADSQGTNHHETFHEADGQLHEGGRPIEIAEETGQFQSDGGQQVPAQKDITNEGRNKMLPEGQKHDDFDKSLELANVSSDLLGALDEYPYAGELNHQFMHNGMLPPQETQWAVADQNKDHL